MKEEILEVLRESNEEIVEDMDRDLLASGIFDSYDIVRLVEDFEEAYSRQIDVD